MNYRAQKAALTRALKTDAAERQEAVLAACRKVVSEWNTPGNYWPDDWTKWQRALHDVGLFTSLDDLSWTT